MANGRIEHPLRYLQRAPRQTWHGLFGHAMEDCATLSVDGFNDICRTRMPWVPRIKNFTLFGTMGVWLSTCTIVEDRTQPLGAWGTGSARETGGRQTLELPTSSWRGRHCARPIGVGWASSRILTWASWPLIGIMRTTADGWLTGRAGVCISTLGPGALNFSDAYWCSMMRRCI
jgi:hypothetical protein